MMPSLPRMMPLLASALVLLSFAPGARADPARRTLARPKKAHEGGGLRASSRKASETTTFHYPDAAAGGCRQGSSEGLAAWTTAHEENGYLFHDVLSCCAAHFAEDPDACLAASEEVHAMEGGRPGRKLASSTGTTAVVQHRRLGKSNKSGKQAKYHKPNPWKKPPRPPQPKPQKVHGWNGTYGGWQKPKSGKTSKSAKSKSSKTVYKPPYKPRTRDPTPRPTPKPVPKPTPKPSRKPVVDENMVEITMGGMLVAHNLDVPPAGSEEMAKLAGVFEKTILTVLEEGFECDVSSIGGVSTESHNMFEDRRLGGGTGLGKEVDAVSADDVPAPSSDVLFHCRVIKPCPGCSKTDALVMASTVFEETFQQIEEKAESGELTVIFCIYAEVAQVVTEPCQVSISSAEGTSLAIDMEGGDVPSAPTTPRPTPLPIMPKDPTPQPSPKPVSTKPVMEWPPTPMPTEQPATPAPTDPPVVAPPITAFPTRAPVVGEVPADPTTSPVATLVTKSPTASKPSETKTPTIAPVSQPVTMPPAMIEQTTSPTLSPVAAPVSDEPTAAPKSIYDIAASNEDFATLVAAINAADLADDLSGDGTFTVFAPPNSAFAKLPEELVTKLLDPVWQPQLQDVLLYHALGSEVFSTDLTDGLTAETLNFQGESITINLDPPRVNDDSNILVDEGLVDIDASNGVIHAIDTVLTPASVTNNIVDIAAGNDNFSTLVAAATAAGLIDALSGEGPLTVFAPTDEAFAALPDGTVESLLLPENIDQLTAILTYHVVAANAVSSSLESGAVETLNGATVDMTVSDEGVKVNDSNVVVADIIASNGIIHVIDKVLIPPAGTAEPTKAPTAAGASVAPTSIPPGAVYYTSFERGALTEGLAEPEWTNSADYAPWGHTTDQAATGIYSMKTPRFDLDDTTPKTSNLTLAYTDEDFDGGTLVFSVWSGTAMPVDALWIYVDGNMMGDLGMLKQDFEVQFIPLAPGPHNITWSYKWNPAPVPAFPPLPPGRIGAAFLDEVYILPLGVTIAPTDPPAATTTTAPVAAPVTTASPTLPEPDVPTPTTPVPVPTAPTTIAPTSIPPGALYYKSFEQGDFPADPEWMTEGDGLWELTTERATSGVYSIRSPVFFDPEDITPKTANVTMVTNPNWEATTLVFSAFAGVEMPFDDVRIIIDGMDRGNLANMQGFERQQIPLSPGPHVITWSYKYNPASVDAFPPTMPGRLGAAFIDDVYFLPVGATVSPTGPPVSEPVTTAAPTPATSAVDPTPVPAPTTIAPTSLPPGAIYFDGFEQGTFPDDDPEWTTEGDGLWELTTERANSGVYSIRSPDFFNPDDTTQKTANVTLRTNPNWDAGALIFSAMAGTNIPFDDFVYYVDGIMRGRLEMMTEFEPTRIELGPGPHEITWSYKYSPIDGLEFFPPAPPDRIGAVFLDDVHFVPFGAGGDTPAPTGGSPAVSVAPTPLPAPTTIAPTSLPPGAIYFDGFEQGTFPEGDPEWTTAGDGLWALSTERANSGVYSIESPVFDMDDVTPKVANVTLRTNPAWEAGSIVFSVLAGTNLPFDDLVYYVDGVARGSVDEGMTDFQQETIPLSPGGHIVTFSYRWNNPGVSTFPPAPPGRIGTVFIDDVYFMPEGVEILPTEPPASGPAPTPVPTVAPVVGGEEVPPVVGDPDMFFDGFETGDFTGLEWVIDGEQVWMVDDTNPFEGTYSAHINSADISISGGFAELNLPVSLDEASFIQFYFYAPVAMPFENFELRVDGQFLTGLNTDDETWTQAGAILSAGEHIVSWRLTKNPSGVPDELLGTLPKPPFWTGEAWLDNVALLPSTSSFSEGWESGDFTANPWVLSGDGEWSITDSKAVEGSYSATIASDDIDVDAAGVAELSIDIITEQGGTLAFQVLPSIEGPFEIANVLVDDIAVLTYSAVLDDWQPQMIDVQPGKRTVTFQLVKNPGGVPAEIISTLPSPPGREGQIWVDDIVFTANEAPPS